MAFRGVWCALMLAAPWTLAQAACAPVDGWQDGRAGKGRSDGCDGAEYAEAHRLGASLHELEVEHRAIARAIAEKSVTDIGVQQRRQRQLDNDIEAIRGLATIKGWPLESPPPATGGTP
ncbi:hypothetical protein [Chiayiivirga flava]|uniref:Uncharacterized protein n=1 Tax=Chiayiivirga flava TaxID=659595 RepID=A0A7W8D4N6_9GAMM|nr:hypothetical protein [Chiayiivirga flava]MBB5207854.1 hypothetical protein [Chiayiivirga flava]